MPNFVWLIIYPLLAALVVFLSILLSKYVDLLDKKTKLSGALLGGILLAGVTSLPELFTSLSGTLLIHENKYVLGNILGSDFFDIIIFGVVYFLFFKKLTQGKVGKQHYTTCLFTGLLLVAVTIAAFVFNANGWLLGWFNPMSAVIIAIYVISVIKTPKVEEKDEQEEVETNLSVKRIWTYLIIASIILIAASITITYVTNEIVDAYEIGKTFGGSLFLGVATSLPEVTATIALCKRKNFNAAYGDILGSCVFNFLILGIADIFSFVANDHLYIHDDTSSIMLMIGTGVALILIFLSILFVRSKSFKDNMKSRIILYTLGALLVSSYIVYLILSTLKVAIV